MSYAFKRGSRLTGDAQAVGEALEKLRADAGGDLRPEDVERAARKRSSPLHGLFEWDDSAAALEYRLNQARHIIRCIVVIDDPVAPQPHVAYVRVETTEESDDPDEESVRRSTYRATADVMSDEELRRQVVQRALRELHAWKERYRNLDELASIFEAIQRVEEREAVMA